ncbi:uncharacterized protein LOC135924295 [Gordionus sp. m RMFG-2023]|uniref:uncharacterized protein LOC135924295 n=1 Tax=Gordionus sp. m RMFG-2023 TaxID=3053472 RepID=UPI0031FD91C1
MQKKNFSQANQNMETINLPHSNTENTQLYGTQVKIPESPQSKTISATFEFSSSQNILKNILGTQIKLPNTTKTLDYTGYSLQNLSNFFKETINKTNNYIFRMFILNLKIHRNQIQSNRASRKQYNQDFKNLIKSNL